jgi:hypothetical protein
VEQGGVISAPKMKSNRANARLSTGPKSTEGRTRSAKNALRHGLSRSVRASPIFSEEVEALAFEIVGTDAGAETQELARQIAEAQIDLRRVRYARHELLSKALADPDYESRASLKAKYELLVPYTQNTGLVTPVPDEIIRILDWRPEGPLKLATILSDMAQMLSAMDRYERRALSRRKAAIRAFDTARSEEAVAAVCPKAARCDVDQRS